MALTEKRSCEEGENTISMREETEQMVE